MSNIRLRRGDTILGLYNDMYPDLPEREKRKLLERWEAENFVDPNRVQAGATYSFPKSNYGEQLKLRGEMEPRVTAADLLDLNNVRNRFITGGEGVVNSLLLAQGKKARFKMSSGGLTHAQAKSIAKMSDDEVIAQIIELQNLAEDLDSIPAYKEWYRSMELPAAYYDKAEQAFIDQQNALRAERTDARAEKLHPGAVEIQAQTVAKGKRRVIIRKGMSVPQVQNDDGTWHDDPTQPSYPRFQDRAIGTYSDANGRRRFSEGPNIGKLVSDVAGLERVVKEYKPTEPALTTDKNGRKRYVESGALVFPTLKVDPTTQKDTNGRLRYVGGPKNGQLVFTEDGEPIPKEYAPKEPKTAKDANGRLRFTSGDREGQLVFSTLTVDPETKTDLNGRLRFVGGDRDGQFVFGGDEGVPKEYAPKDPSTTKAADGHLYYETGPEKGKRVFPGVKVEPKTHTDLNGRLRYTEGKDKGKLVFGDKEIPKEYKPVEDSAKHRNWEHWVTLENAKREEAGTPRMNATELAESYEDKVLKQQIVEEIAEPGESKAVGIKQVAFLDNTYLMKRMLKQLADPEVVVGGLNSVLSAFDSITSQYMQLANLKREGHLLREELYDWGPAAKSAQLQSNILGMAYSLARANEESGGRLSESDVQYAIKMITGSMQSKKSMAASLIEMYNRAYYNMQHTYDTARSRKVKGTTEKTWEEFIAPMDIGHLEDFFTKDGRFAGIGYRVPKLVNGVWIEEIKPISMWEITND